jgi:hypothetical protein
MLEHGLFDRLTPNQTAIAISSITGPNIFGTKLRFEYQKCVRGWADFE